MFYPWRKKISKIPLPPPQNGLFNSVFHTFDFVDDHLKAIFQKYSFNELAVVSVVRMVTGANIVSNLRNGLTTLGRCVTCEKKLGKISLG